MAVAEKIEKLVNLLCFVLGPMIIVDNILDYSPGSGYSDETRLATSIGVGLVAFGLLRKARTEK